MSEQPNGQANVSNEESWLEVDCDYPGIPPLYGFLQLCADRRFHQAIQQRFQGDAGLISPEHYWIHADAGGTPKMECQRTAPDYCYYTKKVRLMGWSAHGNICGGFGDDVPDDVIRRALYVVARRREEDYPEASHYIYFATIVKDGEGERAVVHCLKHERH